MDRLDDWIAPLTEHFISWRLHDDVIDSRVRCYDDASNIRFVDGSQRKAIISMVRGFTSFLGFM